MNELDHSVNITKLFERLDKATLRLSVAESNTVEFKENFDWGNRSQYAKSMAAFANNRGGYIFFGVTDRPRTLAGLSGTRFEDIDEAVMSAYFNSLFAPEIVYEKSLETIEGKLVGFIYTYPSENKPVIAIKNDGDIKEAEIYYRYNARKEKIKYAELRKILEHAKSMERKGWSDLFARIARVGPANAGVVDMIKGTIEGKGSALLIDDKLLPKIKFIKEGAFSEKGSPTLKLVGDVRPVSVSRSGFGAEIRITDDPTAIPVREEKILENYPWGYYDLVAKLRERYSDFKSDRRFLTLRKPLMQNEKYVRSRYLDPNNPKSSRKDFYSADILKEFDKHYKKRKSKSKPAKKQKTR